MKWFDAFHDSLANGKSSPDLIPAGKLSQDEALEQYRYQYRAKVLDSLEESFPALKISLGEAWSETLEGFLKTNTSFRSLDWYPKGFEEYLSTLPLSQEKKELCRFEGLLDRYAWKHGKQDLVPELSFDENSCLLIGEYVIEAFSVHITALYEGETPEQRGQELIIWQKNGGTHFKEISDWERRLFEKMGSGLGEALLELDRSEAELMEFFSWLGGSGLIRGVNSK